jgi:capsular polysaccharide biosynthesis protein
MRYIPLGWPKKKNKAKEPKVIFKKELYYFPKFFRRNINIILNTHNFKIAKYWYLEKKLEKITANTFLTYKILNLNIYTFSENFFKFFLLIKKKINISLAKNEIVIFGPFSWNYAHQIHEFLVRVAYLKKKPQKIIYLPEYMRKIILSKTYKKIFYDKKFKFISNTKIIKFKNVKYLSHIENRSNNIFFKKNLGFLRDEVQKIHKKKKNDQFILVSRENSTKRKLLNEDELYNSLKPLGFKKVSFENLTVDEQIEMSANCKIMIGYHGAGLSNCAYMNKKSTLIEISNKKYPHPHFELFSEVLKINFKRFFCKENFYNLNGICNIEEIIRFVKKIKNINIEDKKDLELLVKLNKFGWPEKKFIAKKPEIIFKNKIFFMPKLFWRKIFVSVDYPKLNLIKSWYVNKELEKFTLKILLDFKLVNINFFILKFFIKFYYSFFQKNIVSLKKDDLILFGPYMSNHTHKLVDFFLRLVYAKNLNVKRIYVPDELKIIIKSTKIIDYLKPKKIIYYNSYKNHIFKNANYLTHIETRNDNKIYTKQIRDYRDYLKKQTFKHNKMYEYVLVSRENNKRKLLNEDELYNSLKPMGFTKVFFEKLSLSKQIEICRNAKILLGYHGAGLSNSFFMRKNQHLLEIVNTNYNHPWYEIYSKVLNLNYNKLFCLTNYKNLDGICDASSVKKQISKIL